MSVNNGKITPPISIDDVKSVLGESSNDLATLCKSSKINKWSPHKPVHSSKLFDLNDADFGIIDKTFKLIVPSYSRLEDLCRDVIIRTPSYTYEKPKGGSSSPYRLGDFKGYNSVINRGWYYNNAGISTSSTSGNINMYYYTREEHASGSYLNLWDFYVFNSCYFGVAVINQQGSVGAFITNAQKCNSGYCNASVYGMNNIGNGIFYVIPFMSNTPFTSVKYDSANTRPAIFYPIDGLPAIKCRMGYSTEDPITKVKFKLANKDLDYKDPVSGIVTPGKAGKYIYLHNYSTKTTYHSIMIQVEKNGTVVARLNKNMQTFGLKPNSDMDYYIEVSEYLKDTGNVFVAYVLTEKADTLRPSDYPTWGS